MLCNLSGSASKILPLLLSALTTFMSVRWLLSSSCQKIKLIDKIHTFFKDGDFFLLPDISFHVKETLFAFCRWLFSPSLLSVIIIKEYWILSNTFSAFIEMIMWGFLPLYSNNIGIKLIAFYMLNQPCIIEINSTWL